MPDKEIISNPSMGSNELGTETNEDRQSGGLSAGTDTQLHLAALAGKKHKGNKNKEETENDTDKGEAYLEADETDE